MELIFVGLFVVCSTTRPASFYLGEGGVIYYRWLYQDTYADTGEVAENKDEAREKAKEWALTS